MEEVRRLRRAKGWNQNELAFYADLAPSVISLLETGKREPNATTLRKLAEALEVDIPDLFKKPASPKAPASPSQAEAPEERRILEDRRLISSLYPFVSILEDDVKRWGRAVESGSVSIGQVTEATEHQLDMATALKHFAEAVERERWPQAERALFRRVVLEETWPSWEQAGKKLLRSLVERYSRTQLADLRRRRSEAQEALSTTAEVLDRSTRAS